MGGVREEEGMRVFLVGYVQVEMNHSNVDFILFQYHFSLV